MTEQITKDLQAILNRNNAHFAETVLAYAVMLEKSIYNTPETGKSN